MDENPDAANFINLDGSYATQMRSKVSHRVDLQFAADCVGELKGRDLEGTVSEALWQAAIIHYCKCFGPPKKPAGRTNIDAGVVFKGKPDLRAHHAMFKSMRDKHVAHDEGTHTFSGVIALIAPAGSAGKIQDLIAPTLDVVTLGEERLGQLESVVGATRTWLEEDLAKLHRSILSMLELHSHEKLLSTQQATVHPHRRGKA